MKNLAEISKSTALLKLGQVSAVLSHFYRKAMLAYCRLNGTDNRSDVLMDFVRRIEANSSAIRELTVVSIERNHSNQYYKLPIGLLLRSCILDSLQGLYVSSLSRDKANGLIADFDQDYVRSLPSRFEVYADRSGLKNIGENILRNIYCLKIEDVFPNQIDFSTIKNGTFQIKRASKPTTARGMYQELKNVPEYADTAKRLYAYFKKYSQYEHFSLMGHGDSLVPFDEDQPMISKPYEYIAKAVNHIANTAVGGDQAIMTYVTAASENIGKINNYRDTIIELDIN